ncbi:MAG: hypothetical protein ACE367_13845 [Acidimicrobiales bacterium]
MAPAPVRPPRTRTPGAWGVPVGATLMVVGIVTGIVIVAVGVVSFVRDVDRLVRTGSGGDLVADLEAGEYFIYDEDDGVDLGPLDVRITRVEDGLGVVPTDVDDGPSYDIAGNSGSAALSFDLPSAGDYRIEATTGVGEIASFAIGRDVGGGPFAALTRGLLIGGGIFLFGLVLTIWGAVQRSRARLRSRAELALDQGRRAAESATEAIGDPDQRRHVATHHGRRLSQTATERAGAAPAPVRDGIEGAAGRIESAVGDLAASTEAPAAFAGRVGDSLGRAQERLAAGESLRSVARDSAGELREVGSDARREAMGSYAASRTAATDARAEAEARSAEVLDRRDDLIAGAGAEVDRNLLAAERIAEETGAELGAALDDAASDITAAAMRSAGAVNEEARAAIDAASERLRAASATPSTPAPPPPGVPPVPVAAGGPSAPQPPPPGVPPMRRAPSPPPPPGVPPVPALSAPSLGDTPAEVSTAPRSVVDERLPARSIDERSASTSHGRVDPAGPVPLAPPPTQRIPSGPRPRPADDSPRPATVAGAGAAEATARSSTGFAALAPPPSAIGRTRIPPQGPRSVPTPTEDIPDSGTDVAGSGSVDSSADAAIERAAPRSALVVAPPPTGRRPDRSPGPGPGLPPG